MAKKNAVQQQLPQPTHSMANQHTVLQQLLQPNEFWAPQPSHSMASKTGIQQQQLPQPKAFWMKGDLRGTTRFCSSGRVPAEDQSHRRRGRLTEVLQPFCREPLPWYKELEPHRPHWPDLFHPWSLKHDGLRALDSETVVVDAGDLVERTKRGILRSSTGHVTYSAKERQQFELDAEDLMRISQQSVPGSRPLWTLSALERAFHDQLGRRGTWMDHDMSLAVFLSLFPKTFCTYTSNKGQIYARILHPTRNKLVDDGEQVMVQLALAQAGTSKSVGKLKDIRVKARFKKNKSAPTLRLASGGDDVTAKLRVSEPSFGEQLTSTGTMSASPEEGRQATVKLPPINEAQVLE